MWFRVTHITGQQRPSLLPTWSAGAAPCRSSLVYAASRAAACSSVRGSMSSSSSLIAWGGVSMKGYSVVAWQML